MTDSLDTMTAVTTAGLLRGQIIEKSVGNLAAPKNIIQSVSAARAVYWQYRTEHLKRIDLYAAIEGLIAGNPPYNPAELAQKRLSHISNFNNLDARSLYERGALAYWNLLNEAETICKFKLRDPIGLGSDDPELIGFADTLAKHWDTVVREWPSFYTMFNTLAGQLVKFGISPVLWPDERNWQPRTVELSRFFVEDQAQADVEKITVICVETIFTAQFLFEIYTAFRDKLQKNTDGTWDYKKCPWNLDELAKLLLNKANQFTKDNFTYIDLMDIQRKIQNGDLTYNQVFSDSIRLVSFFQQEYDGQVSHYMFDRTYDSGQFLYFADRQYKCMQEGIVIFTASPGEFTIHSNRGLGHKIFSGAQAMMQLDCSIIDAARMAASPMIKSPATGSRDAEAIRFYPGTITNIGTAEYVQNNFGENIQQLIGASQYVLQKLQFNTANSGDDPGVPDRNVGSVSPSQARMQSFKEFGVLKNNIAHFYSLFDIVVTNMTIKLLHSKKGDPGYESAKKWKELCMEDGVPKEFFQLKEQDEYGMPKFISVRATRVAGDGSTLAGLMGLQELQLIAGDFNPDEAREYRKQYVTRVLGRDYVPAFVHPKQPDEATGGASLAGVENNGMLDGKSPIFSIDNENRAHFTIHMALGNDTIQRIQQQQLTALEADKIFSVLIPHMGEHLQALSKSLFAQKFVESIKKPWNQLQQYATLNRHNAAQELQANIKKQQEQQAKQQQVMNDEQLKTVKLQGDERRADQKAAHQIQNSQQQSEQRAEIMREDVQKKADNKRLEIQLNAQNKTVEDQHAAVETAPLAENRARLAELNGKTPSPYDIES